MPELLTQSKTPESPGKWPELNRNGGRPQIGTVADIKSESPAGFRRNPQVGPVMSRFSWRPIRNPECQRNLVQHPVNSFNNYRAASKAAGA